MFDVSILLRLVDQLTGPARRAGQAYNSMAQSITRSSAQIQAASARTASSITSVGAAAQRSQSRIQSYFANLRRLQTQAGGGARGGSAFAGSADTFRAIGAWMGLRKSLTAGEDTAKAENKFRALVDDATPRGMLEIRKKLDARMMRSGETYAELLGAAGDAAQIVGTSKIAADIAVAASKLTNIDTAGKTVADFSETLAAVIGPKGTVSELTELSDMLAMQQKLGAATAGGTIEAYKNVVGFKSAWKFDQADMLTAIGMIKNQAPALQDSQIGNMAKYGLRTMMQPDDSFKKKLAAAGIKEGNFMTNGGFDVAKTQKMFAEMTATEKGLKKFKELFSGKNVLAGQFWTMLAGMKPDDFAKYREALTGGEGTLDDADNKRLQGLPGALNSIRASGWMLARMFGEGLTPAIVKFSDTLAPITKVLESVMGYMGANHPTLTGFATGWLGLVAALSSFGIASSRSAKWAGALFRFPFHMLAGVISGLAGGFGAAVASIARMGAAARMAGGALGVLRYALMGLTRFTLIGAAIATVIAYWDELKTAFQGFSFGLSVGWEGSEIQQALKWMTDNIPGVQWAIDGIKGAFQWLFSGFGGSNAPDLGWFSAAQGAAEALLNPLRSIKEVLAAIKSYAGLGDVDPKKMSFSNFNPRGAPSAIGVPDALAKKMAAEGNAGAPGGVTVQANGPNVTFQQAPPSVSVSVTVNAATNASPDAIGAAAASAVGNKVRGALSDAPHSSTQ